MNEENQNDAQIKDEQTSAILATSTIIIFFAVYLVFPDSVSARIVGTCVRLK